MKAFTVVILILICLCSGFSCHHLRAQRMFQPEQRKRTIRSDFVSTIQVDGRLDEPAWQQALPTGDFVQVEPRQGNPAYFKTIVRTLYNQKYLYFGIMCYDTVKQNQYKAPDLRRDFPFWKHDRVGITIDGFNDERNSITFFTNPYGAQRDYLSFDDTYFDVDWNGLWTVRTTRSDSGWVAEFAIPWKTLRYRTPSDSLLQLGINFQRVQRTNNESAAWSPYPRSVGLNRMEYAGIITGIQPPATPTNLQLNVYTLALQEYRSGTYRAFTPKLGGDVKWAITPNLVADATINTDFAQADADLMVNNLTRFSIFFPEKRQFFLENASMFGIGITPSSDGSSPDLLLQPFFSRRIGLNAENRPVPLDVGTRLVYRSEKRSMGALIARQRSQRDSPMQHYYVARYTENIGKTNRIGVIVTGNVAGPSHDHVSSSSYTAGFDGFFRLNKSQSINFMLLRSATRRPSLSGIGGYLQYQYTNNKIYAWWTQALVQKNFKPETGFVSRHDVLATAPGMRLNIRDKWVPFKKVIRDYTPGFNLEVYHQASTGAITEQMYRFTPLQFNLLNGGSFSVDGRLIRQRLQEEFNPVAIPIAPGSYRYFRPAVALESNPSRKLSAIVNYEGGNYYNGRLQTIDANLTYAPLPQASFSLSVNKNWFNQVGQELLSKQVSITSLENRLALNPRIQLTTLVQKNSLNAQTALNMRFSWEYKPLSYVYLVFNSRALTTISRQTEQNGIFKISYLGQF